MPQTIFERALEFVADGDVVGLGSGRAANRFVELLGERVRQGMNVRGVATSQATEQVAVRAGVPLVSLEEGMPLALAVDGADEVDVKMNLIKGYGRALLREKIVESAAEKLVILVGREKLVPIVGSRGKLPIEVVPFALPLVLARLSALGCPGRLATEGERPFTSDNGNYVIDCAVGPLSNPADFERALRAIPGVVATGLFLDMADVVLVGDSDTFALGEERRRPMPAEPTPPRPEVARS